jgi:hypothetical protein
MLERSKALKTMIVASMLSKTSKIRGSEKPYVKNMALLNQVTRSEAGQVQRQIVQVVGYSNVGVFSSTVLQEGGGSPSTVSWETRVALDYVDDVDAVCQNTNSRMISNRSR